MIKGKKEKCGDGRNETVVARWKKCGEKKERGSVRVSRRVFVSAGEEKKKARVCVYD